MRVTYRCDKVDVEISSEAITQFFCHCDNCQAVHGAAYVGESVYSAEAVTVVKGESTSRTLKCNPRLFWSDCGTRPFIDVVALKRPGLSGCLLPGDALRAQFHMHCRFAVRPVEDDLPHYR